MHSPLLDQLADKLVAGAQVAPAASVAVAVRAREGWRLGAGAAGRRSAQDPRAVGPGLLFDLASVSKPFVALAAARLAERGIVPLHTPLEALLDETRGTPSGPVPLELLLAHRGGLEPHRELFLPLREQRSFCRHAALEQAARATLPDCSGPVPAEGFAPVYSDLGYLLAGEALARAAGCPLDEAVAREVCMPLGLEAGSARQWLARRPDFARVVAPTENVSWRGGELTGIVHDENAWAIAGHGLAGQAGLFAGAATVARLGAAVLDANDGQRDSWLSRSALHPLLRPRSGGSLRAGFDSKLGPDSSAGSACGPQTFGHLGFTGTSLWCDPQAAVVTVLLTNRVNPTRDHWAIRKARPPVHDALFAAALSLRETATGAGKPILT